MRLEPPRVEIAESIRAKIVATLQGLNNMAFPHAEVLASLTVGSGKQAIMHIILQVLSCMLHDMLQIRCRILHCSGRCTLHIQNIYHCRQHYALLHKSPELSFDVK